MTRPLLIAAVCGYAVAIACFIAAFSIAGPRWAPWTWGGGQWDWSDWDREGDTGRDVSGGGPEGSRTLAWPGGEDLIVNVPAEVVYTQGAAASLVVTGPRRTLDRLEIDDGRLELRGRMRRAGRIRVTMTAPDVTNFILNGSQRLTIRGYDHDRLEVRVAGSGRVDGEGKTRAIDVTIAGSGDVDLGRMAAEEAEIAILGSGDARIGPKTRAEINIAGSGDVTLTTRPATVDTDIAGSGRVVQAEPEPAPEPQPQAK